MATITPPDLSALAGIPAQGSDVINATPEGFITGDIPAVSTEDMTFAASQNIPARTPVGFDGSGDLVPAVLGGGSPIPAIGMTVIAVVTPGSGAKKAAPVYRSGTFNPALVNWPASYDTDEKKLEAFRDAPTPTVIIMRPVKTGTVTLP